MKLKPGLVLKVNHNDSNHYVQIIKVQPIRDAIMLQILCGKTVNILKETGDGWYYENPNNVLADGLLEKIGQAIDKCQPA
jgi:hypothetical protein